MKDTFVYDPERLKTAKRALGYDRGLRHHTQSEPFYGHSGNWLGFTAYYLHFAKDGLAVMLLSNRSDTDTEYLSTTAAEMFREGGNR